MIKDLSVIKQSKLHLKGELNIVLYPLISSNIFVKLVIRMKYNSQFEIIEKL